MSVTYGFFNSLDGDRVYNADTFNNYFEGLVSDGVFANHLDGFKVTAAGGLSVSVGSGRAIVGNKWVKNDASVSLSLTAAHVTLNRYTKICLRADESARTVSLLAVDGDPASSPVKPDPIRTGTQYEIILAYVYVAAGAAAITAVNIEDTRANSDVCGFVAGLVQQVDTSDLFTQYEAAYEEQLDAMHDWQDEKEDDFDSWFETLTDDLLVETYVESGRAVTCAQLSDLTKLVVPSSVSYDMSAGDILQLYIGGILLPKDRYTVALTSGAYVVTYPAGFLSGNPVEVVIFKSKIGYNSQGGGGGGGGGLSQTEKNLLLTLASKSAYAESDAGTAYDTLETLWNSSSYSVSWVGSGYTKGNTAAVIAEGETFTSTVTANTGYTISTVTATMGGDTVQGAWDNGTVTIPNVSGNIVITVTTAAASVTSISAVYTQSGTVYTTDTLDSLKADLVVTATFSDSTTGTVNPADYTLSGTLTVGTSTITVSFGGKTDTFTVTVSYLDNSIINWDFTQSLTDSKQGLVATLGGNATRDASGLHISSASDYASLGAILGDNQSYEIDVSTVNTSSWTSGNGRLFLWKPASGSGLVYHSSGTWAFYDGSWYDPETAISEKNLFANSTIKISVEPGETQYREKVTLYKNGVELFSKQLSKDVISASYIATLGGGGSSAAFDVTITGFRVYSEV